QVADNVAQIIVWSDDAYLRDWLEQDRIALLHSLFERHRTSDLEGHFGGVDLMVRTVVQLYLDVNNRVSGEYTCLHCALDTSINSRDVFLRNRTADNVVDELVALAGLVWSNLDLNVTVLTFTTGLPSVLHVDVCRLAYGLFVSYLRRTNVSLYR